MKRNISAAAVILALSLTGAYAADKTQKTEREKAEKAEKAKKVRGGSAVFLQGDQVKWTPMPGADGVQMATVEGDSEKGPHHAFIKFNRGLSVPEHQHSADHYTTVISGTLVLTVEGKEYRMGPGAYFSFTGSPKHATRCEGITDCVIFMDTRGAWDVKMDPEEKAAR